MRLQFDDAAIDAVFAVDGERRTITGLAVPWNQSARSAGKAWRFARGAVKWASERRVKLLRDHDNTQAFGYATKIEDTEAGLIATFKVMSGPEGDRILAMAADGVLDGLSIGVVFRDEDTAPDPHNPGGYVVSAAALREVSLTAMPAFDDSRLTSVRASEQGEEEPVMPEEKKTEEQAPVQPATPAPNPAPAPAPEAPKPTESAEKQESGQATFALTGNQLADLIRGINAAPAAQAVPTPAAPAERPVVDPTARPTAATFVSEPLPYRFTRESGRYIFSEGAQHDFSTDLFAVGRAKMFGDPIDPGAAKRVNGLVEAAFAVTTTNVSGLMPKEQRPDLWQPQMDYATPLWDMVNSGVTDGTPFELPKYDSSSGLVTAATEGVEPAPGAFAVTTQTITPTALWGKVEITRQAIRRGGNPQTSGVVWEQMLRSYFEAREAAVATFLNTLTAAADIVLTVPTGQPDNDEDQATVASLEQAIADLQFVRGGNRFSAFAVHQFLYRILSRVKDDAGRPLYPMINPQNANGTTTTLYRSMDIGGTTAVGAWALGAATGTDPVNSWLFDPAKVRGWASTPDRLDWDFGATIQNTDRVPQLSMVTIGIFGDIAFGCLDINGVRQVITDPVGS